MATTESHGLPSLLSNPPSPERKDQRSSARAEHEKDSHQQVRSAPKGKGKGYWKGDGKGWSKGNHDGKGGKKGAVWVVKGSKGKGKDGSGKGKDGKGKGKWVYVYHGESEASTTKSQKKRAKRNRKKDRATADADSQVCDEAGDTAENTSAQPQDEKDNADSVCKEAAEDGDDSDDGDGSAQSDGEAEGAAPAEEEMYDWVNIPVPADDEDLQKELLLNDLLKEAPAICRPVDMEPPSDDDDRDPDTGLPIARPIPNFQMYSAESVCEEDDDQDSLDMGCCHTFADERMAELLTGDTSQISMEALVSAAQTAIAEDFIERLEDTEDKTPAWQDAKKDDADGDADGEAKGDASAEGDGSLSGAMTPISEEPDVEGKMTPPTDAQEETAGLSQEELAAKMEQANNKALVGRRSSAVRQSALRRERRQSIENAVQAEKRKSLAKIMGADGEASLLFKDPMERRRYTMSVEKAGDVLEAAGIDDPEEAKEKLKLCQQAMAIASERHRESIIQMVQQASTAEKEKEEGEDEEEEGQEQSEGKETVPQEKAASSSNEAAGGPSCLTIQERMAQAIAAARERKTKEIDADRKLMGYTSSQQQWGSSADSSWYQGTSWNGTMYYNQAPQYGQQQQQQSTQQQQQQYAYVYQPQYWAAQW